MSDFMLDGSDRSTTMTTAPACCLIIVGYRACLINMLPKRGGLLREGCVEGGGRHLCFERCRLVPLPPPQVRRETIVGAKMTQFVAQNRQAG